MSNDTLDKYIEHRPKVFDADKILVYLNALDKNKIKAEDDYEEVKDQMQEQLEWYEKELSLELNPLNWGKKKRKKK